MVQQKVIIRKALWDLIKSLSMYLLQWAAQSVCFVFGHPGPDARWEELFPGDKVCRRCFHPIRGVLVNHGMERIWLTRLQ